MAMGKLTLTTVLFIGFVAVPGAARAEVDVALLADVYGTVNVADSARAKPEDRWPVKLLQTFPRGKVLVLNSDARATLFFPGSGMAMEMRGPGKFEIAPDAVRALGNAAAPARLPLNAAFRDIKLDRSNLAPAGVRMRDPRQAGAPSALEPRGVVLSTQALVFRWEPASGEQQYRFRLVKNRIEPLYETLTKDSELSLPAEVHLPVGERLQWQAEDVAPARSAATGWKEFVIATPEVRALAEQIDRAIPSATATERVLRDVLLMQRSLPGMPQP
jgi:hypothetical protein